jgi:hypothetical protein
MITPARQLGIATYLLVSLAAASPAAAQIATAAVTGTIEDQTGGALSGVTITVRNTATSATRTTTTDAQGRYRVAALEPGSYEVRAELVRFNPVVRTGVGLTVGGTTTVDLVMNVGALSEEVAVRTEAPLMEPSKAELSRVVSTEEITRCRSAVAISSTSSSCQAGSPRAAKMSAVARSRSRMSGWDRRPRRDCPSPANPN